MQTQRLHNPKFETYTLDFKQVSIGDVNNIQTYKNIIFCFTNNLWIVIFRWSTVRPFFPWSLLDDWMQAKLSAKQKTELEMLSQLKPLILSLIVRDFLTIYYNLILEYNKILAYFHSAINQKIYFTQYKLK